MKSAILIGGILLAITLPQTATAQCGTTYVGSAIVSCERGVRVIRATQGQLPSISPAQSAQMSLQQQRMSHERALMAQRAAIEAQRLQLERERVRNQGYLYRDTNSPLRQRSRPYGYGSRGYVVNRVVVAPRR